MEKLKLFPLEISDMVGHGYVLKRVGFLCLIVDFDVNEECFLVREIPVVGDMVVHLNVGGTILYCLQHVSA